MDWRFLLLKAKKFQTTQPTQLLFFGPKEISLEMSFECFLWDRNPFWSLFVNYLNSIYGNAR